MDNRLHRRKFLSSLAGLPVFALAGAPVQEASGFTPDIPVRHNRLKTSLNAYSFNVPLKEGKMSLDDMLDFCADAGFDGVDITGYYFKGYPQVPADEYLLHVKRKAFSLGLAISGTGVRNDLTLADKNKRQQEVDHIKRWIEVAAKIGAPVLRIFAGTQKNEGSTRQQVTEWILNDIQTCVTYGKQHGIIIGLQNHNDFIQTATQINEMIEAINSPWFGLILDTGSYRVNNPYDEIATSVKHAINWQIKEKIFINGAEVDTDLNRILQIIKASEYNGYLPIETLGPGDPKTKITTLLTKLKTAITKQ